MKTVTYRVHSSAQNLDNVILEEINKKILNKNYNLTGEQLTNGEINISTSFSLITFKPNLGPMVTLNWSCKDESYKEKKSYLTLSRVNGATFYVHYWFSLILTVGTLLIAIHKNVNENFDYTEFFLMPIFILFYFGFINFNGDISTNSLIKRVEKILRKNKVKFEIFETNDAILKK